MFRTHSTLSRLFFGVLVSVAFSTIPIESPAWAQVKPAKPPQPIAFYGEGYVLLQHGNVLHGFVKPHADRVTVVLEKGNEVTIPNRQILTVGKSKETLYSFQVNAIRKWGSGEHWHMAQWCIQNGLLDQAIEHYTELEKIASESPKFKQLDLQLRQALLADAKVQQALADQGIPNPIQPVSYEELAEVTSDPPATTQPTNDEGPSSPASPRVVPGYLRRSFQTEVQTIVVSRCGQSGCHGMLAKNDFQIFQPVGDQAATITQRNLDSLMRYVDHSDPMQTSFLQYAIRPHGQQRNPSLPPNRDEDRALLDKIAAWLASIQAAESGAIEPNTHRIVNPAEWNPENSGPVAKASALIPKSAVQAAARQRSFEGMEEQDRNAKLSKPPRTAAPAVILDASELQEIEDAIAKLEEKEGRKKNARDPLDPAEFNSKYAREPRK